MVNTWRGCLAAAMMMLLCLALPSRAAVDGAVCSTADIGAGVCTGNSLRLNTNEEISDARRRGILPLTSVAGVNAITATTSPVITSYQDLQHFSLFPTANNTGAVTLNIAGIGVKPLLSASGVNLTIGQLLSSTRYIIVYHATGDHFRLMTERPGIADLQRALAGNKVGYFNPAGNSGTNPGIFGMATPTTLGTATNRAAAATNLATRARRLGYVSDPTAGSFAGHHSTVAQYTIGATGGIGGFYYVLRFVPSNAAAVSGERMFAGMRNATTTPTNVEPSSLTNAVGLCQLSTSANLHICYGGSTAQAPINLGASFPATGLSDALYELTLDAPANTQVVNYQVINLSTSGIATGQLAGTVGTAIPSATTMLGHTIWKTNNATALAVGVDVVSVYIETDN